MTGKKVLVVDDSREIRELLGTHLRGLGYQVITSGDGEDALLICQFQRPDLMILDVMMPEKNGWEVLKELKQHPQLSRIKVIVLTAIGEQVGEMTSELHGADAHMDKPFDLGELADTITALLGSAKA